MLLVQINASLRTTIRFATLSFWNKTGRHGINSRVAAVGDKPMFGHELTNVL